MNECILLYYLYCGCIDYDRMYRRCNTNIVNIQHMYSTCLLYFAQLSADIDRLKAEVTACQQEKEIVEALYMDKLQRKIGSRPLK